MMWRDATNTFNFGFAIERSKDTSGNDTSTYITHYSAGFTGAAGGGQSYLQQSVVFGVGATTLVVNSATRQWTCTLCASQNSSGTQQSQAFNGNTAISPMFPMVGYFDNPSLGWAVGAQADFTELAVVTATMYGATHTWLLAKGQSFNGGFNSANLMRWE
jgi:hypothetical protein